MYTIRTHQIYLSNQTFATVGFSGLDSLHRDLPVNEFILLCDLDYIKVSVVRGCVPIRFKSDFVDTFQRKDGNFGSNTDYMS